MKPESLWSSLMVTRLRRMIYVNVILEDENERRRETLHEIRPWANAYPLGVFPEPDMPKVARVLMEAGITLDCVSASILRHALGEIGTMVDASLKERPGDEPGRR